MKQEKGSKGAKPKDKRPSRTRAPFRAYRNIIKKLRRHIRENPRDLPAPKALKRFLSLMEGEIKKYKMRGVRSIAEDLF